MKARVPAASRPGTARSGRSRSDWYTADDKVIAPMVKEAAAKYAAKKKITPGRLATN